MKFDFKCKHRILSIMYMLKEQNTQCHSTIQADMNNIELNAAYITSPYYGVPRVKISHDMNACSIFSLKVCCMSFWIFLLVTKGPVFVRLLLRHDCGNLPGSVLPGSEVLSTGKWPASLKYKKLIGCGTTTRKCQLLMDSLRPPKTHTCKLPFYCFNIVAFFFFFPHNDFIMGIIVL